jgi:hypothetical protein
MALSAAKSDLTLSLVGEDETAQMLAEARDRVGALETKLKSLKTAGDQAAAAAQKQMANYKALNSQMASTAKSAEGVMDGFNKVQGAVGKVTSALGFYGAAITGAIAIGSELVSSLVSLFTTVDKQAVAFKKLTEKVDDYTEALKTATIEAKKFSSDSSVAAAGVAAAELALAKKRGIDAEIGLAEIKVRDAEAVVAKEAADKALDEARAVYDEATQMNRGAHSERRILEEEIRKRESTRSKEFRAANFDAAKRAAQEKAELEKRRGTLDAAVKDSDKAYAEVQKRFEQAQELHRASVALATEPPIITLDATEITPDPKPRGGGRAARKQTFDEFLADLVKQGQAERKVQEEIARDEAIARQERLKAYDKALEDELKAQQEAAEARRKFMEEQAAMERMSVAQPVLDFAEALTSNLVPALGEVEGLMNKVTDIFEKFSDGQATMTEALGQGAMEIAAFAAKSIGGVKAEAAVRAVYETAMGFATLATPALSVGHFTAAAMLAGVATGVISTGGASGAAASKGMGKPSSSTGNGGGGGTGGNDGQITHVYNMMAGVIDGQSTTRAFRRAELQSRGSGFATAGGW